MSHLKNLAQVAWDLLKRISKNGCWMGADKTCKDIFPSYMFNCYADPFVDDLLYSKLTSYHVIADITFLRALINIQYMRDLATDRKYYHIISDESRETAIHALDAILEHLKNMH